MKFSENWLRTFVNPPLATRELAHAVTMSGVEVEHVEPDGDDWVLTLKPTPNRGDCLSLVGIAREIAAVTGAPLTLPDLKPGRVTLTDRLGVMLEAPQACPRYCGRLVKGVDPAAPPPEWMTRRLAASGIRSVSALVDITNYVMLELGQPLHAFDAARLAGGIRVRQAKPGEKLVLLNDAEQALTPDFLVIADDEKAVALAGIMGGLHASVSDVTRDVFLESAFFSPAAIAGRARRLNFATDSSYRFERGVDFAGTAAALERATQLVVEICGGAAGPVTEMRAVMPSREPVRLRLARIERVLGIKLDGVQVSEILRRLRFEFSASGGEFRVTPPSFRFDIAIEEDVIEELARIHGYDRIPATLPSTVPTMLPLPEERRDLASLRRLLVARDYQEVITYSFVDAQWERDFASNSSPVALANPIASQMSVMRSTLAGGLIQSLLHNVSRRQSRARLFETGRCFMREPSGGYRQPVRIGGLSYGEARHEQWGLKGRPGDFYDIKSDVEALIGPLDAEFEAVPHPALHPGKSAMISIGGMTAGWIGELHPRWQQKYDLPLPPVLFELDYEALSRRGLPAYKALSPFPPVRRDIAAEVDAAVSYQAILDGMRREAPAIVTEIGVFDIYRGTGVEKGKKSLAFRVLLQDTRKTLTDAEVESAISQLRRVLQQAFNAKLR